MESGDGCGVGGVLMCSYFWFFEFWGAVVRGMVGVAVTVFLN